MRQLPRLLVLACLIVPAGAQAPLAFDAASVKPSTSGSTAIGGVGLRPPDRYAASNVLLRTIIVHAYRLKRFQVVGGPDWIDAERFDIDARAPQGTTEPDALFQMAQALLRDRFKFVAHRETRELPIYALVEARNDGRLGAQMKPVTLDCSVRSNQCGIGSTLFNNGGGNLNAKGRTVDDLASALGGMLDRAVINRSHQTGQFEIDLQWGADRLGNGPDATNSDLPPIFTAVQEQLGLRLEPSRGPVEVLVIDRIERPSEN